MGDIKGDTRSLDSSSPGSSHSLGLGVQDLQDDG